MDGQSGDDVSDDSPTELSGLNPEIAAGTLVHVAVINPDGPRGRSDRAYFADFLDVPQANIFHAAVEKILRDGVTAGCGNGNYCPQPRHPRADGGLPAQGEARRRLRSPAGDRHVFADVPSTSSPRWIEELAARGITAGCGGGDYCPDAPVTRAQMAVFLLKTLLGPAYVPPDRRARSSATSGRTRSRRRGSRTSPARGITGGCQARRCSTAPTTANTRAQMAAFL